ncbi:MAG TPA: DUF3089 domain-containing protein, partial [Acidimicrobiales bacterium]|nr:DUF3089 domain-containing protein [Acidimicrobiales bacterium]
MGRAKRRLFGGPLRAALAAAVVAAVLSPAAPPASASREAPELAGAQGPGPVWLCRPGQAPDPCTQTLAVTAVTAAGTLQAATWPRSATASKFDCFYVYPTESLAATGNTALKVTKVEAVTAYEQAAPLSRVCDVWAPAYRSQTFPSVLKGLAGDEAVMRSTFTVAYDSVLPAWLWFLAHTQGKPVVLVGDSQGSAVLIHLISAELDHEPSVLSRLLVAVLV